MANLSNINNVLRVSSDLRVGINTDAASYALEIGGTNSGIKLKNSGASGKVYSLLSDTSGNFQIYDDAAASGRLVISSAGNATFAGEVTLSAETQYLNFKKASTADVLASIISETDAGTGGKIRILTKRNGDTQLNALTLDDNQNATFAGDVSLADSKKAIFGTGSDLQIYHDSSNSYIETISGSAGDLYIKAQGSGHDLYLQSTDDVLIRPQGGNAGIKVIGQGAVELYYNNSKKLETTSTGVTISSDLLASGLYVGAINASFDFYNNGTSYFNGAVTIDSTLTQSGGADVSFSGDVIQSGTSKSLKYWRRLWTDANNDWGLNNNAGTGVISVSGMGTPSTSTTTFAGNVTVNGAMTFDNVINAVRASFVSTLAGATVVSSEGSYASSGSVKLFEAKRSGGAVASDWSYDDVTTDMSLGTSTAHSFSLKTGNTRALTINSSQNVGIGTTSLTARLDILTNSATGDNNIDRHVRFRADNGEQRFNFFVGRSGNSANLSIYNSSEVIGAFISSDNDSYFNGGNVGIGTTTPSSRLEVNGVIQNQDASADPTFTVSQSGMTQASAGTLQFTQGFVGTSSSGDTVVFRYNATNWKSWLLEFNFVSTGNGSGQMVCSGNIGGYNNNNTGASANFTQNFATPISVSFTNVGQNNVITFTGNFGIHMMCTMRYSQGGGDGAPISSRASLTYNS